MYLAHHELESLFHFIIIIIIAIIFIIITVVIIIDISGSCHGAQASL